MKPLDWILLALAVPWFLLCCYGKLNAMAHPLYASGLARSRVKTWEVLVSLGAILTVVWRVWG